MPTGNLSVEELKAEAKRGSIDTVLTVIVDMQGRLMGKRCHVAHFLAHAIDESHCCNYLVATDLAMTPVDGYASTSWAQGYGDYVVKPDLATLRRAAWLEATALVICDLFDQTSNEPVAHAPRHVLQRQCEQLHKVYGLEAMAATEMEFFLFDKPYDELRKQEYRRSAVTPFSGVNEDYHILQTTKEEFVMRPIRNHLVASGLPVETSKGEAETGQAELNIRYAEVRDCCEHHAVAKHAVKEIAWSENVAATFLAKWTEDKVGSAAHVHLSLWRRQHDEENNTTSKVNAFYDPDDALGMSSTMKHFVAGLIKYAPEYVAFLAPYINSYKRFAKGTFAPTRAVWSVDNRTAGFRLCGASTKSVRIECRIGGADLNPYLALSALLAAGMKGLETEAPLGAPIVGDAYDDAANAAETSSSDASIPRTLRDATRNFKSSALLREAFGDEVIDHYARALEWEQADFDRVVTDYELKRGFELA